MQREPAWHFSKLMRRVGNYNKGYTKRVVPNEKCQMALGAFGGDGEVQNELAETTRGPMTTTMPQPQLSPWEKF